MFINSTNFWQYAESCLDESHANCGALFSLTLQLVGHMANHHVLNDVDCALSLFHKAVRDKQLWSETCVRLSWLKGLCALCNNLDIWLKNNGKVCLFYNALRFYWLDFSLAFLAGMNCHI